MKTTTKDFKTRLKAARRAALAGGADQALRAVERMLASWPDHPVLLVEKARLIQLSDHGEIRDAKRALQRAAEVDTQSAAPAIEMGYYLLCIDDQAAKAEDRFNQAIELSLEHLIEAIAGKTCAVLDQDDPVPAHKRAETEELLYLGTTLAKHFGKDDAPVVKRLFERAAEYRERFGATSKPTRNGRKLS